MVKPISVKQSMPELNSSVMAYRTGHGWSNLYLSSDGWMQDGWGCNSTRIFNDVSHWMPLPEEPEDD